MVIRDIRTSIKLEPEFWDYLKAVADWRRKRLPVVVSTIAEDEAEDGRNNLASTIRVWCLEHAKRVYPKMNGGQNG